MDILCNGASTSNDPRCSTQNILHVNGRTNSDNLISNKSGVKYAFMCMFCDRGYQRLHFYEKHLKSHHNSSSFTYPFKCKLCKRGFMNETLVKRHVSICEWLTR